MIPQPETLVHYLVTALPPFRSIDALMPYAYGDALDPHTSYLPLADFTIFNATYYATHTDSPCDQCNGAGGTLESDMQGDGAYLTSGTYLEQCDCVSTLHCPGCMQPLAYSFDFSALGEDTPIWKRQTGWYYPTNEGIRAISPPTQTETPNPYGYRVYGAYEYADHQFIATDVIDYVLSGNFVCLCCNWAYDGERHNDAYDDSYDDADDRPYDELYEGPAGSGLGYQ